MHSLKHRRQSIPQNTSRMSRYRPEFVKIITHLLIHNKITTKNRPAIFKFRTGLHERSTCKHTHTCRRRWTIRRRTTATTAYVNQRRISLLISLTAIGPWPRWITGVRGHGVSAMQIDNARSHCHQSLLQPRATELVRYVTSAARR